jgi:hypothetical protein
MKSKLLRLVQEEGSYQKIVLVSKTNQNATRQ